MRKLAMTISLVCVLWSGVAWATPTNKFFFNQKYETAGTDLDVCNTCHTVPFPTIPVEFNFYGADLSAQGAGVDITTRLTAIEGVDSDLDGVTNGVEITVNGTFPGDPSSVPVVHSAWGSIKALFR